MRCLMLAIFMFPLLINLSWADDRGLDNQRQYIPAIWFEDTVTIEQHSNLCHKAELLTSNSVDCINELDHVDRYGRQLVGYYRTPSDTQSIQHELLSSGQARFWSLSKDYNVLRALYETERNAQDKNYAVYQALNISDIPIDQFTIVEGTVFDVYERGDNIYINFGENWRTDFTLRIRRENYRFLKSTTGIDIKNLQGAIINMRGVTYDYNGPAIDWTLPTQVFIKTPKPETTKEITKEITKETIKEDQNDNSATDT